MPIPRTDEFMVLVSLNVIRCIACPRRLFALRHCLPCNLKHSASSVPTSRCGGAEHPVTSIGSKMNAAYFMAREVGKW
jgi:hypothetical protein